MLQRLSLHIIAKQTLQLTVDIDVITMSMYQVDVIDNLFSTVGHHVERTERVGLRGIEKNALVGSYP